MKRTYDFATIGFRPHTETEEFVTIGVLALDVQARYFGFTLLNARRTGRVHPMFPTAKALYKEARKLVETELAAIQKAVNGDGFGTNVPVFPTLRDDKGGLFGAITSPREGVICYPVKGRRMAENMEEVLDTLRNRFIDRHLLPPAQAVEQEMTKHLAKVLRQARLIPAYKRNVTLGNEEYMVPFAFAHMTGDHRADRALRPLNFDLATPTEIYNHGDEWITRLKRLERQGYRPDRILFALRAPGEGETLRQKAFEEIRDELTNQGYEAPPEEDVGRIVNFARIEEPADLKLAQ
ncbi:MAG: DUF3037 domain-containing protein [Verrucomicrobia bacterium]|nr:DUF3037 domain-containing protein [Verrucomicrobiota bacterium]